ncbi:MAG: 4-hydroxythreonine-4-phosphate dehydrogenase PdxA [Zavarzinella sp.]
MGVFKPTLVFTLGDVAGIGPEVIVRSWIAVQQYCHPVIVGDLPTVAKTIKQFANHLTVQGIDQISPTWDTPENVVTCLNVPVAGLVDTPPGVISALAGRGAYDFLVRAIAETMAGRADGIVTAPLQKEGLSQAGVDYPGHTEILAAETGTSEYAMVLYGSGIAVAHVTLHTALRNVFGELSSSAVSEKIRLLHELLPQIVGEPARIAVAALNPHAGDGGLFGNEEALIIQPAVAQCQQLGINVVGPLPVDTLFVRAFRGEFNAVAAIYHDQGHIAMKLKCGWNLVNVTMGLPIVRTSVAHGTAYDIAGKGIADPSSMIHATEIAARLASSRRIG